MFFQTLGKCLYPFRLGVNLPIQANGQTNHKAACLYFVDKLLYCCPRLRFITGDMDSGIRRGQKSC